jgi:hypothetical protein
VAPTAKKPVPEGKKKTKTQAMECLQNEAYMKNA